MRKFGPTEFRQFLRLVDAELERPCTIVVIGGGAVALAYKGTHVTSDLDLWSSSEESFWDAAARANRKVKEAVPVQRASIAEPPYDFEERLIWLRIRGLRRLEVMVPEAHDLALLKTARAEAHDLDAIEDIHREHPLNLATLVERYEETKSQVMGPPSRFKLRFLAVVARLFGEQEARRVEKSLRP